MYIEAILAIQRDAEVRQRKPVEIPLAIMTSGDTHARTVALLEENRNFGMSPTQITLLQQEKVASLNDNNVRKGGILIYIYIQHCLFYLLQVLEDTARAPSSIARPLAIWDDEGTPSVSAWVSGASLSSIQFMLTRATPMTSSIGLKASIARDASDPYTISTKPHGHGDVHYLLHSSGLARKWLDERKQFVVFFQDTNALVFRSVLVLE